MARSWNGFVAQNQEVKEQWGILEKSRREIEMKRRGLVEGGSSADEPDIEQEKKFVIQVR